MREVERATHDIFDDASSASLLNKSLSVEQLRAVTLKVSLWVFLTDTQALELTDNTNLHWLILNDDIAWLRVVLGGLSALNDGLSFGRGAVRDPTFDDDVT